MRDRDQGAPMRPMSIQPSGVEKAGKIAKQLQTWLATMEGAEALRDTLERIDKTATDLQGERELDAQALERSVTL